MAFVSASVEQASPSACSSWGDLSAWWDCGNGIARQIIRAGFALKDLKSIFITHQHSDHRKSLLPGMERGDGRHCELLQSAASRHDDGELF